MELLLPRWQGGILPHRGSKGGIEKRQPDLETLTSARMPPRPPGSVSTLVEPAAELPPKGMIRFPLWASYFVPTTWSVFDSLYETGGPFHLFIKEPVRRTSFYKTQKLPFGLSAVSCFVTSQGRDSFEYSVAPTKGETLRKLKEEIRGKYGNAQ